MNGGGFLGQMNKKKIVEYDYYFLCNAFFSASTCLLCVTI